jgi:serine/threonine protein kinase
MDIQSRLYHPNLVRFLGAVFDEQKMLTWILSEYVVGGSLKNWIEGHHKKGISPPTHFTAQFSRDILSALDYLHSCIKVMHRDVKPSNVLISLEGTKNHRKIFVE